MLFLSLIPIEMKPTILLALFTILSISTFAQSPYTSDTEVIKYLDGKTFADGSGMTISYGYISSINTYGITITNKQGNKFIYFNCDLKPHGAYCDISGMSPTNGETFGFRVFKDRLVVGYGQEQSRIFYLVR